MIAATNTGFGRAGEVLRQARLRQQLTLKEVEARTGLDFTTISKFERGVEGKRLGRKSLELMADAVRLEGRERLELFRPLGLPPSIESELSSPDLAGAFEGAQLHEGTVAALRHRHLARLAEKYLEAVARERGRPVDPVAILDAHGIRVRRIVGQRPPVQLEGRDLSVDAVDPRQRARFLIAHGAAHAAMVEYESTPDSARCSLPEQDELEASANALAWRLLVPSDRLIESVHALTGEPEMPWDANGDRRIAEIAQRFDVPFLPAAKRLAEEGLLAEMYGLSEP